MNSCLLTWRLQHSFPSRSVLPHGSDLPGPAHLARGVRPGFGPSEPGVRLRGTTFRRVLRFWFRLLPARQSGSRPPRATQTSPGGSFRAVPGRGCGCTPSGPEPPRGFRREGRRQSRRLSSGGRPQYRTVRSRTRSDAPALTLRSPPVPPGWQWGPHLTYPSAQAEESPHERDMYRRKSLVVVAFPSFIQRAGEHPGTEPSRIERAGRYWRENRVCRQRSVAVLGRY
jgi:hypothetical protein